MPSSHFTNFLNSSVHFQVSFLYCGDQNWTKWQCSSYDLINPMYNRRITSFGQLDVLCLIHPKMHFDLLAASVQCWLMLRLLSTSTSRFLLAELLSSNWSLSSYTCLELLHHQLWHLAFSFAELHAIDDCPIL